MSVICYDAACKIANLCFMLNIDLRCHSTISDGLLTPTQLVKRTVTRDVEILALTDHDICLPIAYRYGMIG